MAVTKVTPAGLTTSQIGKNLVINGAMTVDQRGGASGAGNHYTLDRWEWNQSSGDACTKSQDSTVPSGAGFGYSLKIDVTTAGGNASSAQYDIIQQCIEAQNLQHLEYGTASAKTLVLSFWFRSPKTGTHCVAIYAPDGDRSYIREFTIASADTFEYFSMTFPGDTGGTIDNNTGAGFLLLWPLQAGSNFQTTANQWASGQDFATSNQQNLLDSTSNNIYITGVQLEVGDGVTNAPSDFEFEDYGTTLRKCRRYYERLTPNTASNQSIFQAYNVTTTVASGIFNYEHKRAAPSLTFTAGATFEVRHQTTTTVCTAAALSGSADEDRCLCNFTVSSGLTAGEGCVIRRNDTDTTYIEVDAEL